MLKGYKGGMNMPVSGNLTLKRKVIVSQKDSGSKLLSEMDLYPLARVTSLGWEATHTKNKSVMGVF